MQYTIEFAFFSTELMFSFQSNLTSKTTPTYFIWSQFRYASNFWKTVKKKQVMLWDSHWIVLRLHEKRLYKINALMRHYFDSKGVEDFIPTCHQVQQGDVHNKRNSSQCTPGLKVKNTQVIKKQKSPPPPPPPQPPMFNSIPWLTAITF